jgi:uncharacterized protein CbrC (UPF0167 family)
VGHYFSRLIRLERYALCALRYAAVTEGDVMKSILDQMEEHIAAIRNLQRNFDFHSKRLEKLMRELKENHLPENKSNSLEEPRSQSESRDIERPSDSVT